MCKYINSWAEIARALVVVTVMSLLWLVGVHIYEYVMPTNHYYEYKSVIPAKDAFSRGDALEFISSVVRHRAIETQWQDRLYCNNGKYIEKYPTQVIPASGTEYMQAWEFTSLWKYSYSIEPDEQKCRMCGNVVGVTPYWYKKVHSYCTDWFAVNI